MRVGFYWYGNLKKMLELDSGLESAVHVKEAEILATILFRVLASNLYPRRLPVSFSNTVPVSVFLCYPSGSVQTRRGTINEIFHSLRNFMPLSTQTDNNAHQSEAPAHPATPEPRPPSPHTDNRTALRTTSLCPADTTKNKEMWPEARACAEEKRPDCRGLLRYSWSWLIRETLQIYEINSLMQFSSFTWQ